MNKAHTPINWQNSPETKTPLNAINLNKMDMAIGVIDDRVIQHESDIKQRIKTINRQAPDANGELPLYIPKNTSDLTNNSGYVTKAVDDLLNYFLKSETYSRAEVNALVTSIPKFSILPVYNLPTTDISSTTIYLLRSEDYTSNLYTEYIYVNGEWEILGTQAFDLTGYATETYVKNYAQPKGNYLTEHQDLSGYAKKATTLAGYGITDAATKEEVERLSEEIDNLKAVCVDGDGVSY